MVGGLGSMESFLRRREMKKVCEEREKVRGDEKK